MVVLPGETSAETLAAIIADEMAIGMINGKATAHGDSGSRQNAGDQAFFGGLLGEATIIPVPPRAGPTPSSA